MSGYGKERVALVLGAGPVGLQVALDLREGSAGARVDRAVIVTEPTPDHPWSWPPTMAFPAAAGYGQPFQAGPGLREHWWPLTRDAELAHLEAGGDTQESVSVTVGSVHRHGPGHRPGWATSTAVEELAPAQLPARSTGGFRWASFVLDPARRRDALGAQLLATGRAAVHHSVVRDLRGVRDLSDRYAPDVVIDALGLGSHDVFGDERISGKVGHLLTFPNAADDRRVVMDEEALQYVRGVACARCRQVEATGETCEDTALRTTQTGHAVPAR